MLWKTAVVLALSPLTWAALLQDPSKITSGKKYDYIIAGGGAAGSVLANRLTEDGKTHVLLVEAGSSDYKNIMIEVPQFAGRLANTQFDWNFTTVPQPSLNGRSLGFERGHVLGGSTCINFMAFTRGSQDDWNRFAKVTNDQGWSWNSILPYAKKLEHFVAPIDGRNVSDEIDLSVHGLTGPVHSSVPGYHVSTDGRVLSASQQLSAEFPFNHDENSGNMIGLSWSQVTIANGTRQSASLSYLDPILNRSNLDIVVNTHVIKLLETGTCDGKPEFLGVQISQPGSTKIETVYANKEVIVSTGAAKTPQLLMLSGIGDPAELTKLGIKTIISAPDVGKNVQDHPLVLSSFTVNSTDTLDNLADPTFAAQQLALWQTNRTGELGLPTGNQLAWLRLPANNSIFQTTPDPSAGPTSGQYELILNDGFLGPPPVANTNFFTAFTVMVSPTSRGNVTLNSTSPFAAPIINPGYLSTQFDIVTMREGIKSLRRFMAAPAWNGWIIDEFGDFKAAQTDAQIDQFARENAETINHISGTAAMGKVLNSDLTVKGAAGLRVVDASAFPFIPAAHTQVPTYILAERAADLIKGTKH
jgi:choline dehydrogenase-like flavoprotein